MKNKVYGTGSAPRWSRLDNTAKIFPSNSTAKDSKVFRFACELKEEVNGEILQRAADKTLEQFPHFRSVMKKGLFWYYLEESTLSVKVSPEKTPVCAPIYQADRRTLLFRVLYFGRRISLEAYHVLADGAGAMQFLCTMVYYYLLERHGEDFPLEAPELTYDASRWEKQDDSFRKYYEKPEKHGFSRARMAYRLKGERYPENRLGVIEGRMPLKELLACSRERGVTLTELMTGVLLCAIYEGMSKRDLRRPVVITVPVNLRGFFPSKSARNFFTTINVEYDFRRNGDSLEEVLSQVKQCFQEKITKEKLQERMNLLCELEHSLPMRLVPLFLKNPVLRLANLLEEQKTTASFSNVGKIMVPKGMESYIHLFGAAASPNMLQASACSFGEYYVAGFAGPYCNHDVERAFFRRLGELGIDVEIGTNLF